MHNIKQNLGMNIKKARESSKLSIREVAALIGTSHVSVQSWENGKVMPQNRFIEKLAKALNVEAESLLLGSSLYDELRNAIIVYLSEIKATFDETANLSELLEVIKKNNPSSPSSAVGDVLYRAIREFDSQ